ncbi:MAG: ATP-dependent 6-phosphofructokinase [Planctomycetes bacterium]|nr:ATP-dependent 6-phosphofructokinase [Planctomycetota bacterium]
MKLGVFTVGSDVPGLNAVIRAVVRTATLRYHADVFGIANGFHGLLDPPAYWPLSQADVVGLSRRGGTILGANRDSPFDDEGRDRSSEIMDTVNWLGLDGLICIGGEGSLAISERLYRMGLPLVAIPKSIENDTPETAHTFGSETAVDHTVNAIDMLQTTSEATHRVMYLEVTGSQAGWIALRAALGGGADVVLIPEVPFKLNRIESVIVKRRKAGKRCTIVVAAEGARPAEGEDLPDGNGDSPGSMTHRVARAVAARTGDDYRVTVLGHLLRGGDPNAHDRILATRFGAAAVKAVSEGNFGTMVAIRDDRPTLIPLSEVVGRLRSVEADDELIWTARSLGIDLADGVEVGPEA